MSAYQHEMQLRDLVSYITDYLRFVIENGKTYNEDNFFMMLNELNPEQVDTSAGRFLEIIVDELKISR